MTDPWRVPMPDRFGAFWQRHAPSLGPWLADLETRMVSATSDLPPVRSPVFICGMARSGSTILLESLARLPGFTSHRYADFPLLWTQYWWNRLRSQLPSGAAEPVERAHRDRIRVTRESPEAFEEPIWAHFFPPESGGHDVLDADTFAPRFESLFRDHIAKLLMARRADRYVSKGNYNTLRMGYLARLFPDARFVVPIRAPAAHLASLMRQDALYQSAPAATLRQIAARGHHEFGPQKRALRFPGQVPDRAPAGLASAAWWLRQWLGLYRHAAELAARPDLAGRVLMVPYEAMGEQPLVGFARLFRFLGVSESKTVEALQVQVGKGFQVSDQPPLADDALTDSGEVQAAEELFRNCLVSWNRSHSEVSPKEP